MCIFKLIGAIKQFSPYCYEKYYKNLTKVSYA